MNIIKKFTVVLIIFFCSININLYAQSQSFNFIITLPEFKNGIEKNAIFSNQMLAGNYLEAKCGGNPVCTAKVIKKHGAGKQAIAFAQWNAALIVGYKKYENIYVIKAWMPGARLRQGIFLGNNKGQIFQIDDWIDANKPLNNQQRYHKLMLHYFPNIKTQTRYGCNFPPLFKKMQHEFKQLIFQYPLVSLSGGSGYPAIAYLYIGFDFDKEGNFLKAHLVKVTLAR